MRSAGVGALVGEKGRMLEATLLSVIVLAYLHRVGYGREAYRSWLEVRAWRAAEELLPRGDRP